VQRGKVPKTGNHCYSPPYSHCRTSERGYPNRVAIRVTISRSIKRREGDSNPRDPDGPAGFQDRCIQPLCHLSERRSLVACFTANKQIGGTRRSACAIVFVEHARKTVPVSDNGSLNAGTPDEYGLTEFSATGIRRFASVGDDRVSANAGRGTIRGAAVVGAFLSERRSNCGASEQRSGAADELLAKASLNHRLRRSADVAWTNSRPRFPRPNLTCIAKNCSTAWSRSCAKSSCSSSSVIRPTRFRRCSIGRSAKSNESWNSCG
jgi:hypothetical protein